MISHYMPKNVLLIDLHPSKSLSAVIQEAKRASSVWAKSSGLFPVFEGWWKELELSVCPIHTAMR